MPGRFDAIVIGMGPGGEVAAYRLLGAGKRVAVVERELIGGECAYWACIPTKTLLRPLEVRNATLRTAGTATPELNWQEVASYRDYMVRNLDDGGQVKGYEDQGATVVKGVGRLVGPGVVEADGQRLEGEHVIIATGSEAFVPPVEGLADVPVWTNREAATLKEVPDRVLVMGGGPVGLEFSQMLARLGTKVTMVEKAGRLLQREEPRVGELLRDILESEGIEVRAGRQVKGVSRDGGSTKVVLDDGSTLTTDIVLVATGRRPRMADLGLESVGVQPGERGLPVDDRCRLADGLWAIGDVTGVMPFTHVAKYQGRIVADNILGRSRTADYRGVPRVVFSDPEVAAVGLTEERAREEGVDVVTATVDIPGTLARPWTYEREPRGELRLIADRSRRVLVGAWAVAPLAGEWIHFAALAVRAQVPVDVLRDAVPQFPTYSEAFLYGLEALDFQTRRADTAK